MNDRLLIACDLHNTLLHADPAWEQAFCLLSGREASSIRQMLASKTSRRSIAAQLDLRYEDVYERYFTLVQPNRSVIDTIAALQDNYPVVLVSGASRYRVMKDIQKLGNKLRFDGIFTKETFCKACISDWEQLRTDFGADRILYIGNDPDEDVIQAHFVQSVLVPPCAFEVCYED